MAEGCGERGIGEDAAVVGAAGSATGGSAPFFPGVAGFFGDGGAAFVGSGFFDADFAAFVAFAAAFGSVDRSDFAAAFAFDAFAAGLLDGAAAAFFG